jgi:hypothetical protein
MSSPLQSQSNIDPSVITIRTLEAISVMQTLEPPRRSLRQFIAEPVSELRKRKWVPSFHRRDSSPNNDMASLDETVFERETTSEDSSPRPPKECRRQTSTTERIVGTLKKLLRRDSHHAEKSLLPIRAIVTKTMQERHSKRDKAVLETLAAEGVADLPNVDQYFDQPGRQSGPSTFWNTHDWTAFQAHVERCDAAAAAAAAAAEHGTHSGKDRFFWHLGLNTT